MEGRGPGVIRPTLNLVFSHVDHARRVAGCWQSDCELREGEDIYDLTRGFEKKHHGDESSSLTISSVR